MAKRRKSEVLPAAQSREEAIALLTRYAEIAAGIEQIDANTAAVMAQRKAGDDAIKAPLITQQEAIFLRVKPWWAVAGATVVEGDRKTAELGGCLLGHRTGNPTLKHPTPVDKAVGLLVGKGWVGLLRVKYELDKPAIAAALRWLDTPRAAAEPNDENIDVAEARTWFASTGFRVVQSEDFFIDRLPPKGQATETVADPAATQTQRVAA